MFFFSKSFTATAVLALSLALEASAHALVTPALAASSDNTIYSAAPAIESSPAMDSPAPPHAGGFPSGSPNRQFCWCVPSCRKPPAGAGGHRVAPAA